MSGAQWLQRERGDESHSLFEPGIARGGDGLLGSIKLAEDLTDTPNMNAHTAVNDGRRATWARLQIRRPADPAQFSWRSPMVDDDSHRADAQRPHDHSPRHPPTDSNPVSQDTALGSLDELSHPLLPEPVFAIDDQLAPQEDFFHPAGHFSSFEQGVIDPTMPF
jgi:hypothetical protein